MIQYIFSTTTPQSTWTITHNFNGPPVSDVVVAYNSTKEKILPASVVYTNANVLTVNFSVPVTGEARLIGEGVPAQPTTSTDTSDLI